MSFTSKFTTDAVVVGSGHNGLAAAITLARAGLEVTLLEAQSSVGGGLHTSELTLPGFHHDLCSGVHPMAAASPFFSALPLASFGLEWITPTTPLAHPLGEEAVLLHTSLQETLAGLGNDAKDYSSLIEDFNHDFPQLKSDLMGPMLRLPKHPFQMIHFGMRAMLPAHAVAHHLLKGYRLKALFAGLAGHSGMPFHALGSSAIAMMLTAAAHHHNWPFPRGGAQQLAITLAKYFQFLGGKIQTETRIDDLRELPRSRITIFDLGPNEISRIVGIHAPAKLTATAKRYRYGPGTYKIDYALREPVPWKTAAISSAGTIHVGGTYDEIAQAEWDTSRGRHPERPFVLAAQPSLFDASRAPEGQHTFWAYCHVPHGSTQSMQRQVEAQIERFAPGFQDVILARRMTTSQDLMRFNPNFVGGDVNGGRNNLLQLLRRPVLSTTPYRLPLRGYYQCSAATPPGGGIHGMGGHHAAQTALRDHFPTTANRG